MTNQPSHTVRIDFRSLICLRKQGFLAGDNIYILVVARSPDGSVDERIFPNTEGRSPARMENVGKHQWLFQGDRQALHVWEGELADGEAVELQVLVFRGDGSSTDLDSIQAIAGYLQEPLALGGSLVGGAAAAWLLGDGRSKAALEAGRAVGRKMGGKVARSLVGLLSNRAAIELLGGETEARERLLGSLTMAATLVDGDVKAHVQCGPGTSIDGWRRLHRYYPSPSKSGKTLRLNLTAAAAKYGAEFQVRDLSKKGPTETGGVCFQWDKWLEEVGGR